MFDVSTSSRLLFDNKISHSVSLLFIIKDLVNNISHCVFLFLIISEVVKAGSVLTPGDGETMLNQVTPGAQSVDGTKPGAVLKFLWLCIRAIFCC